MPRNATIYRIFVASPSDCHEERSVIPDVISVWNRANSTGVGLFFEPVLYETDALPEQGGYPQDQINRRLIDDADILVACFWARVGSVSPEGVPHTIEEINQFVDTGRPSLLYFSDRPLSPENIDLPSFEKLKEFKQKCQYSGVYSSYRSLEEFRTQLLQHLSTTAFELRPGANAPKQSDGKGKRKGPSKYTPDKDLKRLKVQSDNIIELDREAIQHAVDHIRRVETSRSIRVLDVGCADGHVTFSRFSELQNVTVLGVDKHEGIIESAQHRFGDANFDFQVADITDQSWLPDGFDLIFAAFALHHMARDEGALARLWGLLNPGGALVARSPDDGLKLTFPSSQSFEDLLWAPSRMPGSSDRLHGRKLYTQMKRLTPNPSDVRVFMNNHTTAGLNSEERHAFFVDHYGHRTRYAEINAESPTATEEDIKLLKRLERTKSKWEDKFKHDDSLFSVTINLMAVATKSH